MATGSDAQTIDDFVYYSQKNRKLAMKIMRKMIKCHAINPHELRRQLSNTNNSYPHRRARIAIQGLVSLGLAEKYVVFKTSLECSCKSQRFVIKVSTYEENPHSFWHLLKCRDCKQRCDFSNNVIRRLNQNDYSLSETGLLCSLFMVDKKDQTTLIENNREFGFFNLLYVLKNSEHKMQAEILLDHLRPHTRYPLGLKSKSETLKNQMDDYILQLDIDSKDSELFEYQKTLSNSKQTFLPLNLFTM